MIPPAAMDSRPAITSTLALYRRLSALPCGRWLFSRAVCWKAPYFASIAPRIVQLQPNRCEVLIRHRRRVQNHLGTVHAIALCNAAELAGGLMLEATLPASLRWIPKGMAVAYLKKARGTRRVVATPRTDIVETDTPHALPVDVAAIDAAGQRVFEAVIDMWLSPRPAKATAGHTPR